MNVKILFFHEKLQHQLPPARIGVPVDVPPVVPAYERAVLGKLDAGAMPGTAAFRARLSLHDAPGHQAERFEPRKEGGIEEVIDVGFDHGGIG